MSVYNKPNCDSPFKDYPSVELVNPPTSIVIPLGNGSKQRNLELRCALRSIETYLSNVGEVFIIGELPDFVTNVIHIPFEEDKRLRYRDRNIMLKMKAACEDERVSDDFLMLHDDHFLLAPYEADKFPYYHHGIMQAVDNQYGQTKQNTINAFGKDRINDYDCHCPILFNKQMFLRTVSIPDWNIRFGYCLKTLYCVSNGIEGEQVEDLKIRYLSAELDIRKAIEGRKWFSIGDKAFNYTDMGKVLSELYPVKSRYERD